MPMHWDWHWDLHDHDHYNWHWPSGGSLWPWESSSYHLKCPTRRRFWTFGDAEFDICARDWHIHHGIDASSSWCHRSCLAARVLIEDGEEKDTNGKGTFKVIIDVHHFRADELVVKVKNNDTVILEGKQRDDRADKASFCITREFTRKYKLPRNYDATQARAQLSADGIMTIIVPAPPALDDVERVVDIVQTGAYFGSTAADTVKDTKAIENGEEEDDGKSTKKARKQTESDGDGRQQEK